MRVIKSINSVFGTFVAIALFSLTLSITGASPNDCSENSDYSISRHGSRPTNSDGQLPYEEKESEKDDEIQDNMPLTCFVPELFFSLPISDWVMCYERAIKLFDDCNDIPLYLSKCVLLI